MTTAYPHRVWVTTTTTGTGTLTQSGVVDGYRVPTAADDGKTFTIYIEAVDANGIPTGQEEVCQSVYTHSGTTWSRGTLEARSSRQNFSAGTKRIAVVDTKDFASAYPVTNDAIDYLIFDPNEPGFGAHSITGGRFPGEGASGGTRGDNGLSIGYNLPNSPRYTAGDLTIGNAWEPSFFTSELIRQSEWYVISISDDGVVNTRPFTIVTQLDIHTVAVRIQADQFSIGSQLDGGGSLIDCFCSSTTTGSLTINSQGYVAFAGTGLNGSGDYINAANGGALLSVTGSNTVAHFGRSFQTITLAGYIDSGGQNISLVLGGTASVCLNWNFTTQCFEFGTSSVSYRPILARRLDLSNSTGQHIRFGDGQGTIYTYSIERAVATSLCTFTAYETGVGGYVWHTADKTNALYIDPNGNIGLGTGAFGTSAVGVIAHKNGTAPSGNVTDCYQQYAADQAAGNSAPHWRTENGDVIKLYKAGTLTQTYSTADATLSAYTSDPESSAYTGAADSEAKLADLNSLRVAYENLRTFTEDLAAFTNSLVDALQLLGVIG